MKDNILLQTIQENCNGVEKGSSKRVIAYLFAFAIIFISIFCVIKYGKDGIPLELIALLITNLLLLLGISAYSANANPPAQAKPTTELPK